MDCSLPGSSLCPWDFPGKNTGMSCHFLLQGIFPTQGSNLGLPHCRQTLHRLSHQGSPSVVKNLVAMQEITCNTGDPGMIPGSGRSLEEENGCSILAWEIQWTEEPGGLQSGVTSVRYDLVTKPLPPFATAAATPCQWFMCCCCSFAKSCLILCDPLDCSTPGVPILHCLMELAQTHVH